MLLPILALGLLLAATSKRRAADTSAEDIAELVNDAKDALAQLPPDYTANAVQGTVGGTMQIAGFDPWSVHIGFRRGHCVGVHPATGARASAKLRDVAKKMGRKKQLPASVAGDEEFLGALDLHDDNAAPSVSGKALEKFKKGLKKVATVAKKVVNNKVVKAIGGMVTKVLPPPISTGFAAIQMGVGVAKKIAGAVKGSKAAKAKPVVSQLAAGRISRPQAEYQARQIGVSPEAVVNAGVALKLRADAHRGDPTARALFATHERVQNAGSSPQAARAAVQMIQGARARPHAFSVHASARLG